MPAVRMLMDGLPSPPPMRAFHETMFKDTRLKTDAIAPRPLGADVTIAVVTYTQDGFTTPSGQVMPKTQTKLSYVFVKTASEWKIAHGQNVRMTPRPYRVTQ